MAVPTGAPYPGAATPAGRAVFSGVGAGLERVVQSTAPMMPSTTRATTPKIANRTVRSRRRSLASAAARAEAAFSRVDFLLSLMSAGTPGLTAAGLAAHRGYCRSARF